VYNAERISMGVGGPYDFGPTGLPAISELRLVEWRNPEIFDIDTIGTIEFNGGFIG
jgi:hypothetical protein